MGTAYKILTVGPAMITFVYSLLKKPEIEIMIFLLVLGLFALAIGKYSCGEKKRRHKTYN